ncbi:hypothetical protein AAG614_11795 [Citromicrobium bathyomarinum]
MAAANGGDWHPFAHISEKEGSTMARRTFGQGVLGLLGGVAFAALSGCRLFGGNSYRFRMTVQVETPGGVRTGSSVYEVSAENKVAITREMATRGWSVKGEAVAVDLPGGRALFAVRRTGAHFGDLMGLSMNTPIRTFAAPAMMWSRWQRNWRRASIPALARWRGKTIR